MKFTLARPWRSSVPPSVPRSGRVARLSFPRECQGGGAGEGFTYKNEDVLSTIGARASIAACFSTADGAPIWDKKRIENIDEHYASPIYGDGKIYVAGWNGIIVVLEIVVSDEGPELKILAKNDLGGAIAATPAIADGRLFVRTGDTLFCFEEQ